MVCSKRKILLVLDSGLRRRRWGIGKQAGIAGVWHSILETSDDNPEEFCFTGSKRICNGVMMNKASFLSDGTWVPPVSYGQKKRSEDMILSEVLGCYMGFSEDNGESFKIRGWI